MSPGADGQNDDNNKKGIKKVRKKSRKNIGIGSKSQNRKREKKALQASQNGDIAGAGKARLYKSKVVSPKRSEYWNGSRCRSKKKGRKGKVTRLHLHWQLAPIGGDSASLKNPLGWYDIIAHGRAPPRVI
ncbi:hypothetical protein TWF192_004830 [Orbilia oligospora]|uniref:Uncharacterized protein n=1 Tax=Orbilia oligospora TaxID=2813651 RepID=A0A6G1LQ42_ORBOL|nr:hypothetical protein TWF191_000632 [Orbilia oligospora]KAF3230290.1 hypothetical protein TWF192_004830 [Orbilia oligospora]